MGEVPNFSPLHATTADILVEAFLNRRLPEEGFPNIKLRSKIKDYRGYLGERVFTFDSIHSRVGTLIDKKDHTVHEVIELGSITHHFGHEYSVYGKTAVGKDGTPLAHRTLYEPDTKGLLLRDMYRPSYVNRLVGTDRENHPLIISVTRYIHPQKSGEAVDVFQVLKWSNKAKGFRQHVSIGATHFPVSYEQAIASRFGFTRD